MQGNRESVQSGCKLYIIKHVCMMDPYPGFPKMLSLWHMLICCCFTWEQSSEGPGEKKKKGRSEAETEGMVLIQLLLVSS